MTFQVGDIVKIANSLDFGYKRTFIENDEGVVVGLDVNSSNEPILIIYWYCQILRHRENKLSSSVRPLHNSYVTLVSRPKSIQDKILTKQFRCNLLELMK